MESNNKNLGIKQMAKISNPNFLNYVNSGIMEHRPHKAKTKHPPMTHIRLDEETCYRLKNVCQLTSFSQQTIGINAIITYLKYIEKELGIDLSKGYNEYKEANDK